MEALDALAVGHQLDALQRQAQAVLVEDPHLDGGRGVAVSDERRVGRLDHYLGGRRQAERELGAALGGLVAGDRDLEADLARDRAARGHEAVAVARGFGAQQRHLALGRHDADRVGGDRAGVVEDVDARPVDAVGEDGVGDEGDGEPVVGRGRDRGAPGGHRARALLDLDDGLGDVGRDVDRNRGAAAGVGRHGAELLLADGDPHLGARRGDGVDTRRALQRQAHELDGRLRARLAPGGDERDLGKERLRRRVDRAVEAGLDPRHLAEAADVDRQAQWTRLPRRLLDLEEHADRLDAAEDDGAIFEGERGAEGGGGGAEGHAQDEGEREGGPGRWRPRALDGGAKGAREGSGFQGGAPACQGLRVRQARLSDSRG